MLSTAFRIFRLSLGWWSPSRMHILQTRGYAAGFAEGLGVEAPPPRPLSRLDRWELRNHRRDCERLGRDPMMPSPEVAAGLAWGAAMMRGDVDEDDKPGDS